MPEQYPKPEQVVYRVRGGEREKKSILEPWDRLPKNEKRKKGKKK
jgi:hypothetical protein